MESSDPDPTCPPPQVLQTHGIIWRHGKIQTLLENFPGDMQGSGHSINDRGQVVGWSGSCSEFVSHALLWDKGKPIDLGTISGSNNIAFDINSRSQVVGFSGMPDVSFLHAFLWENGEMRDLGTLPGDVYSQAFGINDVGQVVGGSFDADFNERAFIWQHGEMVDLNTLVSPDSPLFLIEAEDLNSRGQIIGVGLQASSGEIHGFVGIPRRDDEVHEQNRTWAEDGTTGGRIPVLLPENIRRSLKQGLMSRRLRKAFAQQHE